LNSYAIALTHHGRAEKAFEMFERLLQINANDTTTLNSYGKALADNGDFQKAFDKFERSLQVDANNTIALNSYGYALAADNDFQKAFVQFEKSLQIQPDNHITLFMYATVLEAAQKYEKAIFHIEKIRLDDLSSYYRSFIVLKLGQLCYLAKQYANGKKYFDEVIKNARHTDVGRLQAAKHILAIKPYSQEATDLLREIIETSPNHTQALRMLSLELKPKGYFEVFKTAESALTDSKMLNRAMYHKILNEISMLKAIAYQIVKDDRASEVLSKVIKSIESTYEKMTQRRHEEETKIEQMPTDNYEAIVEIISQTAHDVADIVNNELAIIKRRLQRVLNKLNQKDRLFHKLEKLLQRIESTETALNDLKSVNEGLNLHNNSFKVKTLFETWQIEPLQMVSTLKHATLSFDIQNGDSEFVGDKEKIKSFLSSIQESITYLNRWGNRKDEMWLKENKAALLAQYHNQYVAVINNQVIEFAETEEVLKERIRERKLPLFLPVIQKIEAETTQPPSITDLRQQEESDTLEFKSTLQWDVKQSRKNEELRFEVLGTIVGFMNHEGGTLLIGVQDDHSVLGLEPDFYTLGQGKNLDDFQQLLNNFISDRIGTAFAPLIKIRFEKVEDKEICAIDVKRAAEPVFLDAQEEKQRVKKFYIRQGNTTRLLDVEETHHYIRLNWK